MRDAGNKGVLQRMGKRTVANIVKEDRQPGGDTFLLRKADLFCLEHIQRLVHQVAGAKGMVQPGMHSAGIYEMRHPHLLDMPQPLEPGVLDDPHEFRLRETQEPVHRVIDDLYFQATYLEYYRAGL